MEVNMGLDNLGMPVMGSGTATGVQSPSDPADGAAANNNNNNNGAGSGMDTDMGGFSIGSGSSTPNVGPFEDDASVSVPGTGTRGGTPNTDGSGGAVEWNRWMNVGGM
ncbi:hypothetical protein KEM55_005552 [Ascosphaera atra]|nr:hypothetical protein KEM55_005552 [Ascosphaera atra]